MADDGQVEVVLTNNDRVTLRVGDTFLKIDADQARLDVEVEAMTMVPVPTPEILWRKPPVLAMAELDGDALGRPATTSSAAWRAAGAVLRDLHGAPLPPWPGKSVERLRSRLAEACASLLEARILPDDVVTRSRRLAEQVLRPWTPVFIHGDLHAQHVFVRGDEVTGIIDWSEASRGDLHFDLASLTLAHQEHLDDVLEGYGAGADRDLIQAWQSYRCLVVIPWLVENGYGDPNQYPETEVLRSRR